MNPYFERAPLWRGFHTTFLIHLRELLVSAVVPRYIVGLEENLVIDSPEVDSEVFAVVDVGISEGDRSLPPMETVPAIGAPITGTIVLASPIRYKRRWLTIRDSERRKIVTVIELLSPSNKRAGKNRTRSLAKRERILRSTAHLVEIDLLRGGPRMPVAGLPACDYLIAVSRRWERPRVGLWPFNVRDRLPKLHVPLRKNDPEVVIELKPLLDRIYDGGGYAYEIYKRPPEPPLSNLDATWAMQFIPKLAK